MTVLALLPSILPLGIWCGWTWLVYGEAHPWFLLLGKHSSGSFSTASKFFSLLVTLGSVCLLAPLLSWRIQEGTRRAKFLALGRTFVLALAAWWYHAGEASFQNIVWTVVSVKGSAFTFAWTRQRDRLEHPACHSVRTGPSIESWVLVLSQIVGDTGERWVNVMLPTETGDFVLNDSPTGFLPLERISEQVAVPAPK